MNEKMVRFFTVTFLLVSVLCGLAASAIAEEPKTIQRLVSWLSVDAQKRGLHLISVSEAGLEERLYFLPEGGRGLVVSNQVNPLDGALIRTVLDDQTGWWVRLTRLYGVKDESLNGFFEKSHSLDAASPELVRFEISGGLAIEIEYQATLDGDFAEFLLERLRDKGASGAIGETIPEHAREAVHFLAGSLADANSVVAMGPVGGSANDALLDILVRATRSNELEGHHSPTPMILEELTKAPELSRDARRLLSAFKGGGRVGLARDLLMSPLVEVGS